VCQLLLTGLNDCFGTAFYAAHHLVAGLILLFCLHGLIRQGKHNFFLTMTYICGAIGMLMIEVADVIISDTLFKASAHRLRQYALQFGTNPWRRRVNASLPPLRFNSGWICFKFDHKAFLLFISKLFDVLVLSLLNF